MKKIFFLFILISGISFSQNLEEAIYTATETFISNKNNSTLNRLIHQEGSFKTHIKTKDEQLAFVFLLCNKAFYLNENTKLKEAIFAYEDALNRFNNNQLSRLSDFDIIENCLKPLGNLYTKTGDFTNAISTINQYIYLGEKSKNTKHQVSGAINLAKLYQTIGKHKTVLKIVNEAFKIPNINTHQNKLLNSIKTTSFIALNNYDEASTILNTTTFSKFEKHKNNYIIAFQKGYYKEALTSFQKAKAHINEAQLSNRELAKFYVEEAQLQFILKNQIEALNSLQKAIKILIPNFKNTDLPSKNNLYAENTFIDIFDLYATIQPDITKALKSYELSFYVSELLKDNWTSQETKILNETNNRNRSENCIDLLFNAYKQTNNKSLLFEAFKYSEINKASVLKSINHKKNRLQKHPNDSLLIKEFKLIKEQEHFTNLLIKEQLGKNKAPRVNDLSKQLTSISIQLKDLKVKIEKKYPEHKNFYSLESVQKKLTEDDAVLISYFYGKNNIYQFVISEKNIIIKQLQTNNKTKQSIINFIHLFDNASIINNNINAFTQQAYHIFKLLNLNTISAYKNVVIVPDGVLNFMPFEALLSAETTLTTFEKMPFIVKNQSIVYNSSTEFYLTENRSNKNNNLLGFFPVFKNSSKTLSYSINEAYAIKKEMNPTVFMNAEASKENFIKNASNYGILHLSTHASGGNFSTSANLSFYNKSLDLNELYSLDLNPNLVVLSACETGIGSLYKGEGAMSLARGFQYAGAKNLLFSLWQINDLSTSEIMQLFYKNYSNTQSVFFSNHQSKIDYLESETISNAKKSPYYWSAFVYYGKLDVKKSNNNTLYIISAITIIAVVLLFLFLKYRMYDRNTKRFSC